jgi:[1-hydroxy-2-(trimethylamino)ethyl]phosphonate dioxygenase
MARSKSQSAAQADDRFALSSEQVVEGRLSGAGPAGPAAAMERPTRWLHSDMGASLEPLWTLLNTEGRKMPSDAATSLLHHSLKSATLAHESGEDAFMVTACLLHDIGHLLHGDFAPGDRRPSADRHHVLGAAFLSLWFGPRVTEPVRLHVMAKRCLCAADRDYFGSMSRQSRHSLVLQGGPSSPEEAARFMSLPHAAAAIALRRIDDRANREVSKPRSLALFRGLVEDCRQEIVPARAAVLAGSPFRL